MAEACISIYDAMPSLKSLNLSIVVLIYGVFDADTLYCNL